jgi:hypothetical protein
MPFSDASIVQVNTGGTGATNGQSIFPSLPNAPSANNALVLFEVGGGNGNGLSLWCNFVTPSDYLGNFQGTGAPQVGNPGTLCQFKYLTVDGWPAATYQDASGIDGPHAWLMAEIADTQPVFSSVPPDPQNIQQLYPGGSTNFDTSGAVTSLSTGSTTLSREGSLLLVACFGTRMTGGATPPTVTGWANNVDQPGGWVQMGTHVASSNVAGVNLGLDVAYKVVHQSAVYGATAFFSATAGGIDCFVNGWLSTAHPSQQTQGRAATTSMT